MHSLRAALLAETRAALCLTQPDTEGAVYWWLPKSELQQVQRHESLAQTIITCTAPKWLVAENQCSALIAEPAASDQTLPLF